MAYTNPFPATYQPIYQQQAPQMPQMQALPQQPAQQPQQNNSPMIWVQGETGAKSYLLAPNTTLPLWDSENQTIYLKSTDASGMPSMKILDYVIRDTAQPQAPVQTAPQAAQTPQTDPETAPPDYVTHEELKRLERRIKSQINNLAKKEDDGA